MTNAVHPAAIVKAQDAFDAAAEAFDAAVGAFGAKVEATGGIHFVAFNEAFACFDAQAHFKAAFNAFNAFVAAFDAKDKDAALGAFHDLNDAIKEFAVARENTIAKKAAHSHVFIPALQAAAVAFVDAEAALDCDEACAAFAA
jgi:hypothetical protein